MASVAQQYCLRWNNHRSNLLTVFDELLQNEAFTDVTLSCEGGSTIKCHRMVLAACSPYFQNLFTDLPCKHPVVVLKDVKYSEIKAILEYMYRGEVNVAQDQLAALLKVAETLKVKGLVEENRPVEAPSSHHHHIKEEDPLQHSPSAITTSSSAGNLQAAHSSSHNNVNSPPHSTNSGLQQYKNNPYSGIYGSKSASSNCSSERNNSSSSRVNLSMPWAVPGLPIPPHHHTSPVGPPHHHQTQHPHPAATAAAAMLSSCYDATSSDMSPLKRKKLSSLLMNSSSRDTPILRTVLGQGQADSSQPVSLVCHSDSHDSNDQEHLRLEKHMKNEPSEDAQSPYTDLTIMEDEEKSKMAIPSSSPQSFSGGISDIRHGSKTTTTAVSSGIATYVPPQKPEWKRYKQYTRDEIMSAIDAVRNGMSALQAARTYGVPSRTLYDKVKKLGITTSRPFKRGSNGSSSCFPYGISGTSSPYGGHLSENEESSMNNNSALLKASTFLQHALDGRADEGEALAAMAAAAAAHAAASGRASSPGNHRLRSPSPGLIKYIRHHNSNSLTPSPAPETNGSSSESNRGERDEDCEDQVEDLSLGGSRKQQESSTRVIMPPMNNQVSTIIKNKEEILKDAGGLREEIRREVSVDDAE